MINNYKKKTNPTPKNMYSGDDDHLRENAALHHPGIMRYI